MLIDKREAFLALVAQLAEHVLGKDGVTGSIPVKGLSTLAPASRQGFEGDPKGWVYENRFYDFKRVIAITE